ncbi:MAG: hypothetical protein ACFB02_01940 [Mastigocoleus sp.]
MALCLAQSGFKTPACAPFPAVATRAEICSGLRELNSTSFMTCLDPKSPDCTSNAARTNNSYLQDITIC